MVQRVRRLLRTRAVGHTGTLDPFATGLLVVLVGRATRLARFVEAAEKCYTATARLGFATDTDDLTGTPLGAPADPAGIPDQALATALQELAGTAPQRPPSFSAKKVAGERSHRLARRGEAPELEPVVVTVHRIELVHRDGPLVTFRATVSAGTYLRALARDLGQRLGVGAHLTALRRERIGRLRVEDALPLAALTEDTPLLSPAAVLGHLPARGIGPAERLELVHGRRIPAGGASGPAIMLLDGDELIAVAESDGEWLRPRVVLGQP